MKKNGAKFYWRSIFTSIRQNILPTPTNPVLGESNPLPLRSHQTLTVLFCFSLFCFLSRKRGRSQWRSALLGCPLTPTTSAWTTEVTWSYFSSLLVLLQVCCWQMPPKRIRENPLLICWSIHKTGTAAKTSHSKDVSSSADSAYITAVD